eukprot:GFYU01037973.1.p1 GENE.GFYU01037973.1~~GFYU01037973.1.p1  ORF type:complete len:362 (+),score=73.55 GFYU01037973.1:31-1116(+)
MLWGYDVTEGVTIDNVWYGASTFFALLFLFGSKREHGVLRRPEWAPMWVMNVGSILHVPARAALVPIGLLLTFAGSDGITLTEGGNDGLGLGVGLDVGGDQLFHWRLGFCVALYICDFYHYAHYRGHTAFVLIYTAVAMVWPHGLTRAGILRVVVAHQLGSAGISKIRIAGLQAWVSPETAVEWLNYEPLWLKGRGGGFKLKQEWIGDLVRAWPLLARFLGVTVIIFEVGAIPAVLFGSPVTLAVTLALASGFHVSTIPLLGLFFPFNIPCYAALLATADMDPVSSLQTLPAIISAILLGSTTVWLTEDWPLNAMAVFPYNAPQMHHLKSKMGMYRLVRRIGPDQKQLGPCLTELSACDTS